MLASLDFQEAYKKYISFYIYFHLSNLLIKVFFVWKHVAHFNTI